MRVMQADQAPGYSPPGHTGVEARRLQGLEAGGPTGFWVGLSSYPPGAGAGPAPTAGDTVYVVLAGELEVTGSVDGIGTTALLGVHDSVFLAAGELRLVRNTGSVEARLLVVLQPGDDS